MTPGLSCSFLADTQVKSGHTISFDDAKLIKKNETCKKSLIFCKFRFGVLSLPSFSPFSQILHQRLADN